MPPSAQLTQDKFPSRHACYTNEINILKHSLVIALNKYIPNKMKTFAVAQPHTHSSLTNQI